MEKDSEKQSLLGKDQRYEDDETYEINDCVDQLGFGSFQIKLTFMVGFSWMTDSIVLTSLAVLSPAVQCYWNLSAEKTALISTCVFIGMFFGCWFWGWLCDFRGRKLTIVLSVNCICLFGVVIALSPSYYWMLVSLVMQGFGVAGVGQSITIYSEFLPTRNRAAALIFINIFYVFGNIVSALVGILTMVPLGWRWFIICSCVLPILVFLLFSWWLPESPRYLLAAGKDEKATSVLERIAQDNKKCMPDGKLKSIPVDVRKPRGRVLDLLNKENRITTLILWALWFTAVFSYYGIVLCTAILLNRHSNSCHQPIKPHPKITHINTNTRLFNMHSNVTGAVLHGNCHRIKTDDYLEYLVTALGEIPGLFLTLMLAEKAGRKGGMAILLLLSVIAISCLHFCMRKMYLVILIFILRAFLSSTVQLIYLYTPEVYPTNIRAIGYGTASAMAQLGAIMTPFVSQVLLEKSPHIAVSTYSILLFMCIGGALMLPKETKGKNLEEAD